VIVPEEAFHVLPGLDLALFHVARKPRARMVRTARQNLLAVLHGEEPSNPLERPENAR